MILRTRPLRRPLLALSAAFASLAVDTAWAIGLGLPLGTPMLGQPLRIEVPLLLAPGERLPSADCVRLAMPSESADRQFFPRNARVAIESSGSPRVVIVSSSPVNEPLIEFRLVIGCGNSFGRDFLVLTNPPDPIRLAPTPPSPREATVAPAPTFAAPPPVAGRTLRVGRDTTLNILARIRYPSSQATRDDYRRLMAQANPELFAGAERVGSVPLPAGTVLKLPDNLPPPEAGNESAAAPPASPPQGIPPKTPSALAPAPQRPPVVSRSKDRLVIGGDAPASARPLTPRELAGAMDRVERRIEDQGRAGVEIIDNLKTLNSAFIELKEYNRSLENRLRQMEADQKALRSRLEADAARSLGLVELLTLIVVSGGIGAALLGLNHRLQSRRQLAQAAALPPEPAMVTSPPPVAAVTTPMATMPILEPVAPPTLPPDATAVPVAPPPAPTPTVDLDLEPLPARDPALDIPLEFEPPAPSPAAFATIAEGAAANPVPGRDDAIELADIMASMGLGREAARTLVEHVLADPKRDLAPWLKALEIYRTTGQREEFEWLSLTLRQHLNVQPLGWNETHATARPLESFPHLVARLQELWPSLECLDFLVELLEDNKDGSRMGFPQAAAEEILLLQRVLRDVQAGL